MTEEMDKTWCGFFCFLITTWLPGIGEVDTSPFVVIESDLFVSLYYATV
jgi:hypothetical protein